MGQPWRQLESGSPEEQLYSAVSRALVTIGNEGELESFLPSELRPRSTFGRKYLYLRPTSRGELLLPVLTCAFDFTNPRPVVRFQLGLFRLEDGKTRAVGFRYESPEGVGRHNYFHAQPIRGFSSGVALPGVPPWFPDTAPTFPLDARSSVSLLLCLVVSLYGVGILAEARATIGTTLQAELADLHLGKFDPAYWKVDVGRNTMFFSTLVSAQEFRELIVSEFGSAVISACLESDYRDCNPAQRKEL